MAVNEWEVPVARMETTLSGMQRTMEQGFDDLKKAATETETRHIAALTLLTEMVSRNTETLAEMKALNLPQAVVDVIALKAASHRTDGAVKTMKGLWAVFGSLFVGIALVIVTGWLAI